jgi:hypothetical protein
MRAWHDWSPLVWMLLAAGVIVTALATWGFFTVIWFLTHSD